jgi:hypothetical protein
MADIDRLSVRFITAALSGAGTDGDVYLEIGGREFHIDSKANDYETATDRTYGLGNGLGSGGGETTVLDKVDNDPAEPYPLTDSKIDNNPVWVRFEPDGDNDRWICQYVSVKARDNGVTIRFYEALEPEDDTDITLTFGHGSGKFLFLHRNQRKEDPHFP